MMGINWNRNEHIVLFDVDGTLTEARQLIKPEMEIMLQEKLKKKVKVGLVSGSDLKKLSEQMGGEDVIHKFDYVFPENGLVAYKNGTEIEKMDIAKHMGEEKLQEFINFCLHYMAGKNRVENYSKSNFQKKKNLFISRLEDFDEILLIDFRFKITC